MPPRKRKAAAAPAAASSTVANSKRVRTGESPADSATNGRSRRSTSNDNAQNNFTRTRVSRGGSIEIEEQTKTVEMPVTKKRGRPAKKDEARVPAPKKRGRPPKKTAVEPEPELEPEQEEEDDDEEIEKPKPEVGEEVAPPPTRKGILKNKHKTLPPAAEPTVNGTSKRKRGKVQTVPKVVIKSTKKRGSSKKDRSDEDGLTDQEALRKGAAALKHDNIDPELQYWLMKAEPESRIEKGVDVKFSIDDLHDKGEPEGWDGVRNPVARNNMRAMRRNDLAFFYHSNCKKPAVVGVMRIVEEHQVDETAFDPDHPYYDPKSDRSKPKWELVKVDFVRKFENPIGLKELRSFSQPGGALANMQMLKQSRLSVSSVSPQEWQFILGLAGEDVTIGQPEGKSGYDGDTDGEAEDEGGKFGVASSFEAGSAEGVNGEGNEDESSAEDADPAGKEITSDGNSETDIGLSNGVDHEQQ